MMIGAISNYLLPIFERLETNDSTKKKIQNIILLNKLVFLLRNLLFFKFWNFFANIRDYYIVGDEYG